MAKDQRLFNFVQPAYSAKDFCLPTKLQNLSALTTTAFDTMPF